MYVNPFPNKWAWLHGNGERCHKRPAFIMPAWIKTFRLLNVTTQARVWIAHVIHGCISSTTVADPNSKASFWSWELVIIIIDALELEKASYTLPVIHVYVVCVMEMQCSIIHAKSSLPNTRGCQSVAQGYTEATWRLLCVFASFSPLTLK